jgi:nucleoside-diphosphate-sugar epimerase
MPENRLVADLDHILEHTRDLWEELRGERIFITGGTGFFGCWLMESFAWANDRLGLHASALVLTRNLEAFRKKAPHLADHPAIQFQTGDVQTFIYPAGEFHFVIHAAMETNVNLSNPDALAYFDSAIIGTRRVLDFAYSKKVKKFLLISSGAVYGQQPTDLANLTEEYTGAPLPYETHLAYGHGKRAAEFLCGVYFEMHNINIKIARCFSFSGPYLPLDSGFAIGNFIQNAMKGEPIRLNGDGTPYRSYLYAADLAIWLWTVLFRGRDGGVYNVGSENAISIAALADVIRNNVAPRSEIKIARQPVIGQPVQRYVPSTLRVRQELGLQEWIGLEEGIRRMVKWNRERSSDKTI